MKLRLKDNNLEFTIEGITKITEWTGSDYELVCTMIWTLDGLDKLKALKYEFHFLDKYGKTKKGNDTTFYTKYIKFYIPKGSLIHIID